MATNISTIHINSPIQKVWNALTQPELVKKWQYGSNLITDWKVGSDIRFRNYFVMIYRLNEKEGYTNLEIIQEDNRPGAKQEAPQGEENPVLIAQRTLSESL
jgi:uncharacterized protein YndB with AHSA1/START domain